MPYKSDAQRKLFNARAKNSPEWAARARKWNAESENKKRNVQQVRNAARRRMQLLQSRRSGEISKTEGQNKLSQMRDAAQSNQPRKVTPLPKPIPRPEPQKREYH